MIYVSDAEAPLPFCSLYPLIAMYIYRERERAKRGCHYASSFPTIADELDVVMRDKRKSKVVNCAE
jgi:hypothetical protein